MKPKSILTIDVIGSGVLSFAGIAADLGWTSTLALALTVAQRQQ